MVMCRPESNIAQASPSLLDDLPAAVGLPAGTAEALLGLAADGDGLLELAAIGAVGHLGIGPRHDGAGSARLIVAPRQDLAGRGGLQRGLGRSVGIGDVGLVERFADLGA